MVLHKSKSAFKTIAEVAEELGVATHVLRFWETKFSQIKPMKATGGRRYYRPDDVEVLRLVKNLLYERRYTIEGAQHLIKEKGIKTLLGSEEIQRDFFEDESAQNEVICLDVSSKQEIIQAIDQLKNLRCDLLKTD